MKIKLENKKIIKEIKAKGYYILEDFKYPIYYQHLYDCEEINIDKIHESLSKGYIPIIAPLGQDKEKNIYNINADTAAGAIAGAMKASKLQLLTDVAGILDRNNKLISSLSLKDAKILTLWVGVHIVWRLIQYLIYDDSDEHIKHPLIEEIFSGKKGSGYFKPSN